MPDTSRLPGPAEERRDRARGHRIGPRDSGVSGPGFLDFEEFRGCWEVPAAEMYAGRDGNPSDGRVARAGAGCDYADGLAGGQAASDLLWRRGHAASRMVLRLLSGLRGISGACRPVKSCSR
jgi:hypothetical protein